jgi:coenzyme F420-dependent glucose-6-phosphate dehydrogenase
LLKLGYKASAEQFGPSDLLRFSTHAEEAGFDSVFVSDHFQPWRHTGGHAPFSIAFLGALGARTSRIVMGTSVATPTFRYHPSIVAQAFGTLGCLFPRRIILGVGTGESLNEVPATGMKWPGFKEREGRLRESIELVRRLWREDRVSFEGTYYRTAGATIYDRPETPGGRARRGIHLHERQAARALSRDAFAQCREGRGRGGAPFQRNRAHDRDKGLLRQRA